MIEKSLFDPYTISVFLKKMKNVCGLWVIGDNNICFIDLLITDLTRKLIVRNSSANNNVQNVSSQNVLSKYFIIMPLLSV